MPHGGGGGSHGGGRISSHHSSSSMNAAKLTRHHYRYYTRNGEEKEFISTVQWDVSAKKYIVSRLPAILIVLIVSFVFGFIGFYKGLPKGPLDTGIAYQSFVVDNLGMLSNREIMDIEESMEDFQSLTGIPVILYVDSNDWENHYGSVERYAYDTYMNNLDDESHWLIVYTQPDAYSEGYVDWYWYSMQGDDTDSILSQNRVDRFGDDFHERLLRENGLSYSFIHALNGLTNTIDMNSWRFNPGADYLVFSTIIMIYTIIFSIKIIKNWYRMNKCKEWASKNVSQQTTIPLDSAQNRKITYLNGKPYDTEKGEWI